MLSNQTKMDSFDYGYIGNVAQVMAAGNEMSAKRMRWKAHWKAIKSGQKSGSVKMCFIDCVFVGKEKTFSIPFFNGAKERNCTKRNVKLTMC